MVFWEKEENNLPFFNNYGKISLSFIGGIKMNDNDFVRRIINIYGNRDKEVIKEKLLEASEIHSKLTKVDSSLIKSMLLESYMAFHDLKINDRFSYMVGYL